MKILPTLQRIRNSYRDNDTRDIDAELQSHLQLHIDDNLRSGLTLQEARRQALLKLAA